MESGVVQISVLLGCAGVAARYITQLVVVLWSLHADDKGRQHAIKLLAILRGGPPRSGGPKEDQPSGTLLGGSTQADLGNSPLPREGGSP